jgi:hypothetical protein
MRDAIANLIFGITFIILFAGGLGLLSPRLVGMPSRAAVFVLGLLSVLLVGLVGGLIQTDFGAGETAFSNENWERAAERFAMVKPKDSRYDSAQVLLGIARTELVTSKLEQARISWHDGRFEQARQTLRELPEVPKSVADEALKLRRIVEWGSRYDTLYYTTRMINVRENPNSSAKCWRRPNILQNGRVKI